MSKITILPIFGHSYSSHSARLEYGRFDAKRLYFRPEETAEAERPAVRRVP